MICCLLHFVAKEKMYHLLKDTITYWTALYGYSLIYLLFTCTSGSHALSYSGGRLVGLHYLIVVLYRSIPTIGCVANLVSV